MYAMMLAVLVGFVQPGTGAGAGTGAGGSGTRDAHAGTSLDGTWTVLACEHNGAPVSVKTVTIRNNVITFGDAAAGSTSGTDTGKKGSDATALHPMRIQFGPVNTIMVTDARDGAGTAPGAGGTRPGAGTGTTPGAGATGTGRTGPAGAGLTPDTRMGVYVMAHDYIAICVRDNTGLRSAPGAGGTRPGPGTVPGAGTPATPGAARPGTGSSPGVGTTGRPGTAGAGSGAVGGAGLGMPETRSYLTVILHRSGSGSGAGTGSGTDRR